MPTDKIRILVIENNLDDSVTIRRSLALEADFQATVVNNEFEGIRLAVEEKPDIILLDVYLDGVDGLVVAELLRGARSLEKTVLIGMTAVTNEEPNIRERLLVAGCNGFIGKPLNDLSNRIRQIYHAGRETLSSDLIAFYEKKNRHELAEKLEKKYHELQEALSLISELQKALAQIEQLVEMNRWVGIIAHDLNNPMTSILLHLDYIRTIPPGSPQWDDSLNVITTEASRIREVLRATLDNFIESKTHMTSIDLVQLAANCTRTLTNKALGYRVTIIYPEQRDQYWYTGIPALLSQLFHNLMDNAIDAMRGGGTLHIAIEQAPSYLTVTFEDNGTGLPPQGKVGQLFYTTKTDGHGIGLHVCQLIARAHNAELFWADNHPKGAVFTLRLPV